MVMFAFVIILIHKLRSNYPNVKQVWFSDNTTGTGTCRSLRPWWDQIEAIKEYI